jgi:hypothetical protein
MYFTTLFSSGTTVLILKKLGANIDLTILHYYAVGTETSFIGVFVGSRDNIAPECSRDAAKGQYRLHPMAPVASSALIRSRLRPGLMLRRSYRLLCSPEITPSQMLQRRGLRASSARQQASRLNNNSNILSGFLSPLTPKSRACYLYRRIRIKNWDL